MSVAAIDSAPASVPVPFPETPLNMLPLPQADEDRKIAAARSMAGIDDFWCRHFWGVGRGSITVSPWLTLVVPINNVRK